MNKTKRSKGKGIPFKVLNGKLVHLTDNTPIGELREGATGEVIIDKTEIDFLPAGSTLIARIRPTVLPTNPGGSIVQIAGQIGTAATIILEETLKLSFQRKKDGQLLPCKCKIPSLMHERKPASVNEAYTLISEHFEPHRRSHTGNVFSNVYYQAAPMEWKSLGDLRDKKRKEDKT